MHLYMDKLSKLLPVVKKKQILSEQGPGITYAKMDYMPEGDYYYHIPYLQELADMDTGIPLDKELRIFLVTEEDNIAIKTAFNYAIYPVYEMREEIQEELGEEFTPDSKILLHDQDDADIRLRIISMHGEKQSDTGALQYQLLNTGITEDSLVLYSGLENNSSLQDKLAVVLASPARLQFVQVLPEQLGMPWMRELMMDRECEVLILPKVPDSYYVTVLEQLLDGERCKLAEGLTPAQLVRNLRQKCTNKFREEDLAWSLDQAAKKAKQERRYVLCNADFSLDKTELAPALQILEHMTGLVEMKQLAREYAALSREQAKNPKISELCKHVIYAGSPGTGKTECGKVLAKIMAEEGQSNGNFVMASRKDVIGEYVGQTAPKVAKLFQRARHGVLFIDEAGFLLQETRSSFNSEAIKEFVRYMELYQDVTVIFALYPGEVEDWIQLDAGLSSRIGRIVKFENYSTAELLQIGHSMCWDRGYRMAEEAMPEISTYLEKRRQTLKETFGNAREIRKLVEAAIVAKSVRCFDLSTAETEEQLRLEDFRTAIRKLDAEHTEKKRCIGFSIGGGEVHEKTLTVT